MLPVVGSCLFAYGRRAGELCRRDSDCESGLLCAEADQGAARVCRPPVHQDKQYNEPCHMSGECDISRGLCCQLQRRHRQAPRKVSSFLLLPPSTTILTALNSYCLLRQESVCLSSRKKLWVGDAHPTLITFLYWDLKNTQKVSFLGSVGLPLRVYPLKVQFGLWSTSTNSSMLTYTR